MTVTVSAIDSAGSATLVAGTPFDFEITAPVVVNQPPVAGVALPDQSIVEGDTLAPGDLNVAALISDPDGDLLTYSVDQLPGGLVLDQQTGDILGTATVVEVVTVTVSAIDTLGSATAVFAPPFAFEATAAPIANLAPVPGPGLAPQSIDEGTTLAAGDFNVASLFTDPEGDVLSYSVDQLPTGLTIDSVTADIVGTCLLYTSPSPRDQRGSRMPSSA